MTEVQLIDFTERRSLRSSPAALMALTVGLKRLLLRNQVYLLLGIGAVILVGDLLSPYFLTRNNFNNIAVTGSVVSVLAVGQFMVIVTAGIDLSVGSVLAFSTVLASIMLRDHYSTPVSALTTLACATGIGLVNGLVIVFLGITPFIATLAMLSMIEGLGYLMQGGGLIVISNNSFVNFFDGTYLGIPGPVLIFVAVTLIFSAVMHWTTFGRQLYAIGGNREAARLSGLPVKRNLVLAYSISGLLAGLAGLILAAQLTEGSALLGQGYELNAIAAAVVGGAALFGGTGSPFTAVLGGLLIGTITDIMNLRNIQAEPQLIIQGLLILFAVYFTSGGGLEASRKLQALLFGSRSSGGRPEPSPVSGTQSTSAVETPAIEVAAKERP
jgi:ribose transport system permease protein